MVWGGFHLQNWLANGFLDESVPLPSGASLPPVDLPPDMVGAAPPKPDLTSLCYNNAKVKTAEGLPSLRVPDKIMTAWHDHATFGGEFKQWLAECEANAIPINLKETESQNTKRAAAGQGENPSGQKRGGIIGCTPMGNPYINGCLIPRFRRGYIVRGAPNCPLIEEVVQRLIKTLGFLRILPWGFIAIKTPPFGRICCYVVQANPKTWNKQILVQCPRLKESLHFEVHSSENKHVRAIANNVTQLFAKMNLQKLWHILPPFSLTFVNLLIFPFRIVSLFCKTEGAGYSTDTSRLLCARFEGQENVELLFVSKEEKKGRKQITWQFCYYLVGGFTFLKTICTST